MLGLTDQDWKRLLESIRRGNCVLLCGPDVCGPTMVPGVNESEDQHFASMLARKLAEKLSPATPPVSDDVVHIAQLRYSQDGDRSDLEIEVKDFYAPLDSRTSDVYRDLAHLPFTVCLTTIPAHFLSNAFREIKKTPILDFYHFRNSRADRLAETDSGHPIVYHLYGDLHALDSLVLTETDLLEFLVNVVRGAPPLPAYIAAQLADPQTSFLFLGFGFQRWYTRVLLHALQTYRHRNRSMAVETAAFFDHPDSKQTAIFFEKEHKIEFRHHSWMEFAAELRLRYEAEHPGPPHHEPPPEGPKVFLCYDTRDREQVLRIQGQLHARNVGTWRDQQDLRGGEKWDQRIKKVLEDQVHYVLVLQTPNMLQRHETYIHKEIAVALERQLRFDEGIRFLIPAILEPCDGLERLNHLQRIDLTSPEGLERLAREILEDWQLRQRRAGGRRG